MREEKPLANRLRLLLPTATVGVRRRYLQLDFDGDPW